MALGVVCGEARADWPYGVLVDSGNNFDGPFGATIRTWGPWGDVSILVEVRNDASDENHADLFRYLCSGGVDCPSPVLRPGTWPKAVGVAIAGQESLQPAMALNVDASNVLRVRITLRQKWDADCDDDGSTSDPSEGALDLRSFEYRSDTSLVSSGAVVSSNVGNTNNLCPDRGVTTLAQDNGTYHACYTFKVNPLDGSQDRVRCNDEIGAFLGWVHEEELGSPGGLEDHPAFDWKDGDRVVVGSNRPGGTGDDQVVFHFPDAGPPPFEPRAGVNVGGDVVAYPDITSVATTGGNMLHAVYEGGSGLVVKNSRCPATKTCQSAADWTRWTPMSPHSETKCPIRRS